MSLAHAYSLKKRAIKTTPNEKLDPEVEPMNASKIVSGVMKKRMMAKGGEADFLTDDMEDEHPQHAVDDQEEEEMELGPQQKRKKILAQVFGR